MIKHGSLPRVSDEVGIDKSRLTKASILSAKTLEQLGHMLGFSKERIRQLEDNALKKLRANNDLKHFKDYILED